MCKESKQHLQSDEAGFSLVEMMVAMTVLLVLLGLVSTLFATAMGTRNRQSRRSDALTSARAAIQVISREIANTGYGLNSNGIVYGDCTSQRLHIRANTTNNDSATDDPGEDVTYYYDATTKSIVRYDRFGTPQVSVVVNGISDIQFQYFDYSGDTSTVTQVTTPTANTSRVTITVTVQMDPVFGQLNNDTVTFSSDVTLRNSTYMLFQY